MISYHTKNVPSLRENPKSPKMENKADYEGSECTDTNHSHCDK